MTDIETTTAPAAPAAPKPLPDLSGFSVKKRVALLRCWTGASKTDEARQRFAAPLAVAEAELTAQEAADAAAKLQAQADAQAAKAAAAATIQADKDAKAAAKLAAKAEADAAKAVDAAAKAAAKAEAQAAKAAAAAPEAETVAGDTTAGFTPAPKPGRKNRNQRSAVAKV